MTKRNQRKGQLEIPVELKHHPRKRRHHRARRKARMVIGPSIFNVLFNHKIPRLDALSELIDNAFGPAAGNATTCRIVFGKNKVTVYDDGVGVRDLNAILTPGESGSRDDAEDIGSFGIGAKFGMFHFGKSVKINTVREGRRHIYSIDFGLAQERNQMPLLYRGEGSPSKAKGTEITITDLHEGRHNPAYKHLCDGLAHRYLLAQRAGRKILVSWSGSKGEIELKAEDVVALYEQDVRQFTGEINGKPFTVLAGDIKEYSPTLSGLHVGYGFRFITKITELAGHSLPPLFYGRVILGKEWKTSLSPDKTEVMEDRDALECAIYGLLKEWIEELRKMAEEYRNEQICAKLTAHLRDVMRIAGEGNDYIETGPTRIERNDDNGGTYSDPDPGDEITILEAEPKEKAPQAGAPFKRNDTGIRFKIESLGSSTPYLIQLDSQGLCVILNEDIPIISQAWAAPFKLPVIWSITSLALAARCATDIALAKRMICDKSIFDNIDLNDLNAQFDAIGKVAAYLMKVPPNNKAFIEESIDERGATTH